MLIIQVCRFVHLMFNSGFLCILKKKIMFDVTKKMYCSACGLQKHSKIGALSQFIK